MHTRILIDKGELNLPFAADDRIFLGEGLFETLRVDAFKPCFAFMHWQRLSDSARQLGISFDLSFDDWLDQLIVQIKRDNLYHGGIKVLLTGGSAPRGLAEHGQVSQLTFQTFKYTLQSHPLRLVSAPWLRDAANPIYQLKSVNYLEAILARRQALARGADDALFFNTQHHATETTCANLFLIRNSELFTPALTDGVLPGITRSRILSLCAHQQIACFERSLTQPMFEVADAVFISNSLQGIRSIASLDDLGFESTHPLVDWFVSILAQNESMID